MDKRFFISEDNFKRVDTFLSDNVEEITRSGIKKLIDNGNVLLNGKRVKAGQSVKVGDEVEITVPDPVELSVKAENIPIDIIYQDGDLAIINKAQGMVVHAGSGNVTGTLVNALLYHLDKLSGINGVIRPGIVHRIDKDTSGLLVVAKNDSAHVNLSKQIAEKTCKRIYYALLEGEVENDSGRITTEIGRDPQDRIKMAVVKSGTGKLAVTDYTVIKRYKNYTLVQFSLQTGRTHQIRVHSKYMGHPVVGDPVYGYKKQRFLLNGQLLHAKKLVLTHPTLNEEMTFDAPLPNYFERVLNVLENEL